MCIQLERLTSCMWGTSPCLKQCRTFGDELIVGIAADSVVNAYKPNVPVIPLDQRREMLEALRCVDAVRPYYELEYVSACRELNVDVFVIGEDWGVKCPQP